MTGAIRSCALAMAAALLAACGGGGSAPGAVLPKGAGGAATTGATGGTPTYTAASPSQRPVATATLTIKYPTSFHVASLAAAARSPAPHTSSHTRQPAYVNPDGYDLDVFVVNNSNSGSISHPVNQQSISNGGGDSTQTLSIPLYSNAQQYIVAIESIGGVASEGRQILSIGEADLAASSFNPGDAPTIALTMQMNAENIGMTSDQSNASDAVAFPIVSAPTPNIYNSWNGSTTACSTGAGSPNLYYFATDSRGGFNLITEQAGTGGIPYPVLLGYQSDQLTNANTVTSSTAGGNGPNLSITFNALTGSNNTGVTFTFGITNPAAAIANAVSTAEQTAAQSGTAQLSAGVTPVYSSSGTVTLVPGSFSSTPYVGQTLTIAYSTYTSPVFTITTVSGNGTVLTGNWGVSGTATNYPPGSVVTLNSTVLSQFGAYPGTTIVDYYGASIFSGGSPGPGYLDLTSINTSNPAETEIDVQTDCGSPP